MSPIKKVSKLKKPILDNKIDPKNFFSDSKFSISKNKLILRNKNIDIVFAEIPILSQKRGFDSNILNSIKDIKKKILFVENMLLDAKYDFSREVVFLTKEELDTFVAFSKLFKKKTTGKEYKYLNKSGSSTIIEIIKELAVFTNKKNVKQNILFFNNFLDIYNTFKRFKKDKEPDYNLFSLMYSAASKGKKEIDQVKRKIVLG
jgi:hypothetical protein